MRARAGTSACGICSGGAAQCDLGPIEMTRPSNGRPVATTRPDAREGAGDAAQPRAPETPSSVGRPASRRAQGSTKCKGAMLARVRTAGSERPL